jgi:hypothetical protein
VVDGSGPIPFEVSLAIYLSRSVESSLLLGYPPLVPYLDLKSIPPDADPVSE